MLPATTRQQSNAAAGSVLDHDDILLRISDGSTEYHGTCEQARAVLARIGDKWSVLILMRLSTGKTRYNDLKRQLGISQRMLTLTLRGLERDGLVLRTVHGTIPPRVDYALTALGQSLQKPLGELKAWAAAHVADIEQARQEFDLRNHTNLDR
nr:helix-turn-helix domain-containing protein [uncultured Cupriavidus sp.]